MDDRTKAAIRRRVERFGLRVFCIACGALSRHFTARDGRLREQRCAKCGGRLRTMVWARQYPAKLAAESAEERKVLSALTRWN